MVLPKLRCYRHTEHEDLHFGSADTEALSAMLELLPEKVLMLVESETDIRPILSEFRRSRMTTPVYRVTWMCKRQKVQRLLRRLDPDGLGCFFVAGWTEPIATKELLRQARNAPGQMVREGFCAMSICADFLENTTVVSYDHRDAVAVDFREKLAYILCNITDFQ